MAFEWKVLRKIYGLKINRESKYEIRTHQEIQDLYGKMNISGIKKKVADLAGLHMCEDRVDKLERLLHGNRI